MFLHGFRRVARLSGSRVSTLPISSRGSASRSRRFPSRLPATRSPRCLRCRRAQGMGAAVIRRQLKESKKSHIPLRTRRFGSRTGFCRRPVFASSSVFFRQPSPEWRMAAARCIGTGNERSGAPCQDQVMVNWFGNGVNVVALADGAGSARYSHYGA